MRIESLLALDPAQVSAVHDLYHDAFPEWEREPFELLQGQVAAGRRECMVAVDQGDVLGFSVVQRLGRVPWWWLEYFAVDRSRRGQGLGSDLWRHVVGRLTRVDEPLRLVLEVESPVEADPDPVQRDLRQRRIDFYARLGAVRLPVPAYRVPRLDGSGTESMLLLGVLPPDEDLRDRDLVELVLGLYAEGYGLPDDHALVRAAVSSARGTADPR